MDVSTYGVVAILNTDCICIGSTRQSVNIYKIFQKCHKETPLLRYYKF